MKIYKIFVLFLFISSFSLSAQSSQKIILNKLFDKLIEDNDSNDAEKLEKKIWSVWSKHPKDNRLTEKMSKSKRKIINKRFKKHNYVLNLEDKIKKITSNYKILEIKDQFNVFNPASLFIVSKNSKKKNK